MGAFDAVSGHPTGHLLDERQVSGRSQLDLLSPIGGSGAELTCHFVRADRDPVEKGFDVDGEGAEQDRDDQLSLDLAEHVSLLPERIR